MAGMGEESEAASQAGVGFPKFYIIIKVLFLTFYYIVFYVLVEDGNDYLLSFDLIYRQVIYKNKTFDFSYCTKVFLAEI